MVDNKKKYLLGIDLGASSLRFVLGERSRNNLKLLKKSKRSFDSPLCGKVGLYNDSYYATVPAHSLIADFVKNKLFEYFEIIGITSANIKGLGISVAGKIQKDGRFIGSNVPLKYAEKLGGEYGVNLIVSLKEVFNADTVNISIENDAKSAAIAQGIYYMSKDIEPDKTFYITLSTGIGGGGLRKDLDEIGHIIVDGYYPDLIPACGCGAVGCIEAYASGEGITNQAMKIVQMYCENNRNFEKLCCFEKIRTNERYDLKKIVGCSKLTKNYEKNIPIDAKSIFQLSGISGAKNMKDAFAYYLVDTASERLAKVIVSISNIHGIERFGIGGSVLENNPEYAKNIQEKTSLVYGRNKDIFKKPIVVEVTPLGKYITDYGSLCLALNGDHVIIDRLL